MEHELVGLAGSGGRWRPIAAGPFTVLAVALALLPIRPVWLWAALIGAVAAFPWLLGAIPEARRRRPRPYWRLSAAGLERVGRGGLTMVSYERSRIDGLAITTGDGVLTVFHRFGRTAVGGMTAMGLEPLSVFVAARRLGIPMHVLDGEAADLLDPALDAYRLLYLHISPTGAALPIVTVTGTEPAVVATVAANLAAAAAEDARTPLLVDADLATGLVAGAMRVRAAPGIAELLRGEAGWAEVVASAVFGRERVVDIVPAGHAAAARTPEPDDAFRLDLLRVARRYDLTVLAAPLAHAAAGARSILPAPDVVLCARAAVTRLRDLRDAVDALQRAGLRVQGVVLWDDDVPALRAAAPVRRETVTA